ncbi:caspase domain-containing protein [Fomitopsis serialis]|uniref:caspase domain-containing protein n=1 Tax=Fomitopsis serialis TaxID=139415 RepID=UPI0020083C17|nr:caspase domain-containing protein [Neoantrodia serialis]KAH9923562.1 caspase domain-containing protein [Neoantrodia serialis]
MKRFFKRQAGRRTEAEGQPLEEPTRADVSGPVDRGAQMTHVTPHSNLTPSNESKTEGEKVSIPSQGSTINEGGKAAFTGAVGSAEAAVALQEANKDVDDGLSRERNNRIFALVIAIDEYKSGEIINLHGCIHDGDDFTKFLTETLHVPESRIVRLINVEATRARILDKFDKDLINNPLIHRGDPIVIFYAGHGDRRSAPLTWAAENNMIETICPHDERMPDEKGEIVNGIPDRTFDGLMRHLANEKGDNIIAVFDCCHSGGVMRGMTGTPRGLSPELQRAPIPEDLDQNIWTWRPDGTVRDANMAVPTGFSYPAMRSHVLLAACRQDEKAQENRVSVDGNTRGLFTLHLLKFLRRAYEQAEPLRQLTYARLLDHLLSPGAIELCGHPLDGQHPLCEGKNRDRLLFSTSELSGEESSFAVRYENERLYVAAGRIHGVVKGTQFNVQAPKGVAGISPDGVVLTADDVRELECIVQPSMPNLPADARAVVVAWNSMPMKVRTSVSVSHQGLLNYTMVQPKEYYDLSLETDGDCWIIDQFDPLTFRYAVPHKAFKSADIAVQPNEILEIVARWNFHLYRFNQPADQYTPDSVERLRPKVELHRLEAKPEARQLRPLLQKIGEDLFERASADEVWCYPLSTYKVPGTVKEARIHDIAPYYGLTLLNDSDHDLFPYVFYFDPSNYAIQHWYLPPGNKVKAPLPRRNGDGEPGRLTIGYGAGGTDSIRFSLPVNVKKDTGFLKIFVSTSYVDMRSIEQNSLVKRKDRGADKVELPFSDTWVSSVYVLTCCEREQPAPSGP